MDYLLPTLLWIVSVICIAVGLSGTVVPALPGAPLIFLGALIGAWTNDFTLIGWLPLTLCAVLALASLCVDFIATALGATRVGASSYAVFGSLLGTLIGLPFSIPGIVFGPLVGAAIGELWAQWRNPDYWQIGKVGLGTWVGLLLGTVVKVVLAAMMVGAVVLALLV